MNSLPTLPYKTKYNDQWQHSSAYLGSQDCYEWMAVQLDDLKPRKILDIGCGSGNGLLALIARYNPTTLISLEENMDCIDTTVDALAHAGQQPVAHLRLSYELDAANTYRLFCSDQPVELDPGLSIIQTDLVHPDALINAALEQEAPFDAITVWLIGTDAYSLHSLGTSPRDYRWQIHRRICELADTLLRPGGWIQLVDRSIFPLTDEHQRDLVDGYKELLESTRLEFLKFSNRPYKETGDGGIPMVRASGIVAPRSQMGLNSMISWLPHHPEHLAKESTSIIAVH